jgi:hypothetical protein
MQVRANTAIEDSPEGTPVQENAELSKSVAGSFLHWEVTAGNHWPSDSTALLWVKEAAKGRPPPAAEPLEAPASIRACSKDRQLRRVPSSRAWRAGGRGHFLRGGGLARPASRERGRQDGTLSTASPCPGSCGSRGRSLRGRQPRIRVGACAAGCGCTWGLLRAAGRSLWPAVLTHAAWDLAVLVLWPLA